jgi:hypothetical protein
LCFPTMYSWPALFPIVVFSTLFGFCILSWTKNVFLRNQGSRESSLPSTSNLHYSQLWFSLHS